MATAAKLLEKPSMAMNGSDSAWTSTMLATLPSRAAMSGWVITARAMPSWDQANTAPRVENSTPNLPSTKMLRNGMIRPAPRPIRALGASSFKKMGRAAGGYVPERSLTGLIRSDLGDVP